MDPKADVIPDTDNLNVEDDDAEMQWELEEGIPQPDEPVIQKYFQGRDALIAQEDKHRSDVNFRQTLSPMAQEACSIVGQIRFEESQTVWGPEYEDQFSQKKQDVYPGMMFTLAKERMEKTKLWNIIKRMPKGALLHCHIEAMVEFDWLFREALATDGMHIAASDPITTAEDREKASVLFQYTKTQSKPSESLWSESYTPGTFVPFQSAADSFPNGGRDGCVKWLISRCNIDPEETLNHHHGPNDIWRKFASCFLIPRTVIFYEPIYRKFLARFFENLMEDGVRYVDLRAHFAFDFYKEGSEKPEEGYEEVFRILGEEVEKFQATEQGKGFWGARIIWTTLRSHDNVTIVNNMKECIQAKLAYPHLVAGYDVVGQEDVGRPLADLVPVLLWFRKQCAQHKANIPFFFHAGETNSSGGETDLNLFDAFLLGTRRLGHAFSLFKHPLLMNMAKDRRVCVECCPISNEVLRLTSSIMSHPLPAMLAQGVPVALCNDDPATLGQGASGMTHDFWQAMQAIENLGLEGLGALAENSVRWAAFEDQDSKTWTEDVRDGAYGKGLKAHRMKEWKKDWEKFAQWVLMEYGVDEDLDPEA